MVSILDLFDAINDEKPDEVERLLQTNQFDLEERDELGDTPLLKACIGGNFKIVSLLIKHGANVNTENIRCLDSSRSPVSTAITHMDDSLLRLLVSSGAQLPNILDESTNFEIVEFLFEHGVNISDKCLIESIINGCDFATVRILTDVGVDLNYIDEFGNNALHYACKYNPNPAIVQTLINHGINSDIVNNDGKKPIDLLPDSDDKCKKIINREIRMLIDETPTFLTNDEFKKMFIIDTC